ncbi:MAG TPA: flagellar basal-body rod protein FlgF [Coleofasciculaceae cyanobacterium]|jgi:flagellar basal-body rod protein FlgG
MLRGIYTAASGMLSVSMAEDTLANNLANVNTIGFKKNNVNFESFPEMLINRMGKGGQQAIGGLMTGSHIQGSYVSHTPGALRTTGNAFDLAIEGDGFFTVKAPNGKLYYTRAGNFTLDEQGYITTSNGDYLQGELGNIQLNLEDGKVHINSKGELFAGPRLVDRIKIARFADNQALEKVGDAYYQETSASRILPPAANQGLGFRVHEGTLEESNVNPISELINNIQGLRLYEALQKNIHIHNETLGKAVNEVGRTR